MIVAIIGKEEYLAEMELKKHLEGINEVSYTDDLSSEDLLWLSSDGLFSSGRALVYKTDELLADESVIERLSLVGEDEKLVVIAKSARENTRIYKFLASKTLIRTDSVSGKTFESFIRKGVETLGIHISGDDFRYLIERYAYDSGGVSLQEASLRLSHLSTFEGQISKEEIDYVIDAHFEERIFDVIGLLSSKDENFVKRAEEFSFDSRRFLSTLLWAIKPAIKLHVFTEKELSLSSYHMRSIRPFAAYQDSILEKAVEVINDGIRRLNATPMQKEAYITTIYKLAEVFK